jgi:hypothetical protein
VESDKIAVLALIVALVFGSRQSEMMFTVEFLVAKLFDAMHVYMVCTVELTRRVEL